MNHSAYLLPVTWSRVCCGIGWRSWLDQAVEALLAPVTPAHRLALRVQGRSSGFAVSAAATPDHRKSYANVTCTIRHFGLRSTFSSIFKIWRLTTSTSRNHRQKIRGEEGLRQTDQTLCEFTLWFNGKKINLDLFVQFHECWFFCSCVD